MSISSFESENEKGGFLSLSNTYNFGKEFSAFVTGILDLTIRDEQFFYFTASRQTSNLVLIVFMKVLNCETVRNWDPPT